MCLRNLPLYSIFYLFIITTQANAQSSIAIDNAWARASPPGVTTGAAYLSIVNKGDDDLLLSAKTDAARKAEIHSHVHEDGIMKMRHLEQLDIPAGETITLAPGELHIMLLELRQTLLPDEEYNLILSFEKAGDISTTFVIKSF